jgi:hypothetical protein
MKSKNLPKSSSMMSTLLQSGIAVTLAYMSAVSHAGAIEGKPPKQLPASLEQKVQKFGAELSEKGYEVARGDFRLFTIEDCRYAIESIGNCLGNNPAAPYVIPTLPLWPDEYVDVNMKNLLGPVANNMGWTYRLGENEAIVILAMLPPSGRYFGLQPYIFSREVDINTEDLIYQTLTDSFMKSILFMKSPNPSRAFVFSSIGDSINNVVIEKQSGSAFDQQRFFIITSDAGLERQLSEALLRAGVPDQRQIFASPIPPSFARLGLNAASDDFMTLIRYALPNDEAAGEQWRHQLPLAVLRVRNMKPSNVVAQPYEMPVRDKRVARAEMHLADDVDKLAAAVKQKWQQTDAPVSQFQSLLLAVDLIGENCIKRPMNCLGDTGDADYQISETVGIDSGEIIAVLGTPGYSNR